MRSLTHQNAITSLDLDGDGVGSIPPLVTFLRSKGSKLTGRVQSKDSAVGDLGKTTALANHLVFYA